MYRSFLIFPRKGSYKILPSLRHSGTTSQGSRRVALPISIIASTGLGFAGAIVYGKYDPNFRSTLESIPYVKNIYDFFPKEKAEEKSLPVKDRSSNESKMKDTPSLLKKKPDSKKVTAEPKGDSSVTSIQSKDDKNVANSNLVYTEIKKVESFSESTVKPEDFASNLSETLDKLKKSAEGAMNAQKNAVNAVKNHTIKLYEALDLSEGKDGDLVWKDVKDATAFKEEALKTAKEKAAETKVLIEKLKRDVKSLHEIEPRSPLVKNGEKSVSSYSSDLKKAESEVAAAESEAKSASEYEHLVNSLKDQFKKELNIVLPNYVHGDKGKDITEGDLNLLIAHAHRRIEQLQKQIAKLQVTEKLRVDQAIQNQKVQDEQITESRIQAELKKRHLDLESAVENRVSSLKAKFEADLHQQLLRQAAAHTDHLKEVLKIQEEELDRKHILELEEKLLHQKGVFISEISGNMSRIKGILDFLKAKSEFDASSKASQALWLSCQALSDKINFDLTRNLSLPLARDVASIKIAAGEDDDFTSSVLSSIPSVVVERGVYTSAALKERFEKVKTVCKKVALVDENNDSLFRYILSYLQSLFIIENICIPIEELEGKVAVNPAEWDTFDILNRISYNLKNNDIEQALRYANQLKGEPKAVAKDWITEMKFLLETQLAAKALLAHASAVGVQAYH